MGPTYGKLKMDIPFGELWPKAGWTKFIIPKGTRCKKIETGGTRGKYWIDDLTWMKDTPKTPCGMLRHDAIHYGITIEPENVE